MLFQLLFFFILGEGSQASKVHEIPTPGSSFMATFAQWDEDDIPRFANITIFFSAYSNSVQGGQNLLHSPSEE